MRNAIERARKQIAVAGEVVLTGTVVETDRTHWILCARASHFRARSGAQSLRENLHSKILMEIVRAIRIAVCTGRQGYPLWALSNSASHPAKEALFSWAYETLMCAFLRSQNAKK